MHLVQFFNFIFIILSILCSVLVKFSHIFVKVDKRLFEHNAFYVIAASNNLLNKKCDELNPLPSFSLSMYHFVFSYLLPLLDQSIAIIRSLNILNIHKFQVNIHVLETPWNLHNLKSLKYMLQKLEFQQKLAKVP